MWELKMCMEVGGGILPAVSSQRTQAARGRVSFGHLSQTERTIV